MTNATERVRIKGDGETNIGTGSTTIAKFCLTGASNGGHQIVGQASDSVAALDVYSQHGNDNNKISFAVSDNRTGSKTNSFSIHGNGEVWAKQGLLKLGSTSGQDNYIYSTNAAGIIYQADENGHKFQTFSGSWQNRLVITDAGKVGVGTASPGMQFHINGVGTNDILKLTSNGSGQMVNMQNHTNTPVIVRFSNYLGNAFWDAQYNTDNSFSLDHSDSEKFRITSGGTVGINEASPDANFKLHVDGMGKFTNNVNLNDGKMIYWGDSDTSFIQGYDAAAGGYLAFGSNNERMRMQNNGYLGIGITNPTTKLYLHEGQFTVKSTGECGPYLYRNNGSGPDLVFHSGRGSSFTSPTASGGTDLIGNINFAGYDGSTYQRRATINGTIDDTVGSGNVPTAIAFKTGGSGVTTRMTVSSMGDTRLDSGNLIIKGGRSMDINSNSSWTTFFTFSSSSAVAFVCRFTATENSNTTGYVVTGSVAANQITQAYMADTGHSHSKDILFRLDGTGNVNLQVKADQHTTTRRVRLIDCFVDSGHPTYS
jgi:hypothetical protein